MSRTRTRLSDHVEAHGDSVAEALWGSGQDAVGGRSGGRWSAGSGPSDDRAVDTVTERDGGRSH